MALADIDLNKAVPEFIELLFRNKWFYELINSKSKGTTNRKYLKPKDVCELIEIPDLSVVQQKEFVTLYNNISSSGLNDEIVKQTKLLKKLRESILQEAVQGKLTADWRANNPDTENASQLLKRIQKEKAQLIKDKKIKKEKALPKITKDETPYELPVGWVWSNILDISLKVTDGEHATPIRTESGYKLLSARNVTNEGIRLHKVDYVGEEEFLRIRKRCNPQKGDVLISCSGSVGRVCLVDKDDEYCMVRSAALVKQHHDFINGMYLCYALRSPVLQAQIISKSRSTAQSNLFLGKIKELIFPLPPLEEQKAIVEKVNALMGSCDALEQEVQQSQEHSEMLMQSVLREVFEGEIAVE
jgi:type I restriction enzyme S subunit